MNRFAAAAFVLISLMPFQAFAQEEPTTFDPPKMEDMVKLEVFQDLKKIPDITLTQSGDGLTRMSDFKGKLVVLNLWATWCPPCIEELPSLNALQLAMGGDKLQVVSVSLDKGEQGQKDVEKFLKAHDLKALTPYTDGYEEMPTLDALKNVPGIPVTLIIDPNMKILARYQGDADWNGRASRAVLEYLFEEYVI